MPLKHNTETAYILVLAGAILATGVLLSWLPPFPEGALGWLFLLIVTGIYPLILAPTLKENRADYEFRWLHAFPFLMTLLWGIASFLAGSFGTTIALMPFTFVWSLPLVAIGFILLGIFCVAVVRRSHVRLRYLSGIFAVYLLVGGFAFLQDWNESASAALFDGTVLTDNPLTAFFSGTGSMIAEDNGTGSVIAAVSSSSSSSKRVRGTSSSSSSRKPRGSASSSSRRGATASVSSKPEKLPKSGGELGILALAMVAGYSATLHRKTRERV